MKVITMLLVLLVVAFSAKSQQRTENPNSNWPYLFEEFSPCTIVHKDGNITKVNANYNLLNEKIQFSDKGNIMNISNPNDISEVAFSDLNMVFINNSYYVKINDEEDQINVYESIKGNMNDLMENKGAYGSSTTTASTTQSMDIDIGGINSMDVRMLWDAKTEGKKFRVNYRYYFSMGNKELNPLKKNQLTKVFPS
ncbi:MAG TPA: hypothetical protein VEP89_01430, partial [Draconibacterium sp.]|nr:hypothetical protein [Draconibacterium sp.]